MKNLTELLRDADPLLNESVASEERDCRRDAVLAIASRARDWSGAEPRYRIGLIVALGLVVVMALVFAIRIWSPQVSDVYAAAVRFEVKLAEERPAAGLREAKVSGTNRTVYLQPEPIVTNSDVASARIVQVDHSLRYNVGVEFNSSGAQKIREATASHIGKSVAILLDGQVVMTAKIREPIVESAVISGDISKAEAERIVKGIMVLR